METWSSILEAQAPDFQVTEKVVKFIYHPPSVCSKKCQNPYCLAHIKRKWLDLKHPESQTCNKPIGLWNLGSTCYANTLFQIWFFNKRLRNSVYLYSGLNPAVLELRSLFANLQLSNEPFINPSSLIDLLGLSHHVQQDSLEFSKLLMSLVEPELYSDNQLIIPNEFQGEYEYVTKCLTCNNEKYSISAFYELEIIIKEALDLLQGIVDFQARELLDGANKYFCDTCRSKCDAVRFTRIKRLPKTLVFQLNRFQFDVHTFSKKKVVAPISFPLALDMAKVLGNDSFSSYNLRGVVFHQGDDTNQGHYVASIFDSETQKWFHFDDDNVQEMTSVDFNLPYVAKKAPTTKSSFQSPDAYALIFSSSDTIESAPIPEALHTKILETNQIRKIQYDVEMADTMTMIENEKLHKEEWDNAIQSPATSEDNDVCYVSATALAIALETEIEFISSKKIGKESITLLNQDILCQHSKINPHVISSQVKIIKRKSMDAFESSSKFLSIPILPNEGISFCDICVSDLYWKKVQEFLHASDLQRLKTLSKSTDSSFYVSKVWFKDWKKKNPTFYEFRPDSTPFYDDVFCPHANLCSLKDSRMLISQTVKNILDERYPGFKTIPSTETECSQCRELDNEKLQECSDLIKMCEEEKLMLRRVLDFKRLRLQIDNHYFVLQTVFLHAWKDFVNDPVTAPHPGIIDNSNLVCRHGLLLYDMDLDNSDKQFCLIQPEEWVVFATKYEVKGPVLMVCKKPHKVESDMQTCANCRNERLVTFIEGKITILEQKDESDGTFELETKKLKTGTTTKKPRLKMKSVVSHKQQNGETIFRVRWEDCNSDDDTWETEDAVTDFSLIALYLSDPHLESQNGNVIESTPKRKPRRENETFSGKRRKPRHKAAANISVTIKPNTTVKDLKLAVLDQISIPPLYQKLFLNGKELMEQAATMASLGAYPGVTIMLEIFDQTDKSFEPSQVVKETGFTGTTLLGVSNTQTWECGTCTFINARSHDTCEVCGAHR